MSIRSCLASLDGSDIRFITVVSTLIVLGFLLNVFFVPSVQALTITTEDVTTNTSTTCVTFHGTSNGDGYVWFEYGSTTRSMNLTPDPNPPGTKSFATKKQLAAGTFSESRCGIPLFPGKSYLVQAVGNDSSGYVYGVNKTFTFSESPTPHVTVTYEQQIDAIINSGGIDTPFINGQQIMTEQIWVVYIELLGGSIFFGLIVAFIFMNIVIKQRTVVMAFLLTVLTGTTLWTFMPDEFVYMAQSMCIIAISGLLFWLFMKRK